MLNLEGKKSILRRLQGPPWSCPPQHLLTPCHLLSASGACFITAMLKLLQAPPTMMGPWRLLWAPFVPAPLVPNALTSPWLLLLLHPPVDATGTSAAAKRRVWPHDGWPHAMEPCTIVPLPHVQNCSQGQTAPVTSSQGHQHVAKHLPNYSGHLATTVVQPAGSCSLPDFWQPLGSPKSCPDTAMLVHGHLWGQERLELRGQGHASWFIPRVWVDVKEFFGSGSGRVAAPSRQQRPAVHPQGWLQPG